MTPAQSKYYLQITTSSGVPIYRQIIDQIKTLIATGQLKEGDYIPSIRQLAQELEINPMTISKAYSLLEKDSFLEFNRGLGMKVKKPEMAKRNLEKREDAIIPLLKEVVTKTKQLSLNPKKVTELLKSLWEE